MELLSIAQTRIAAGGGGASMFVVEERKVEGTDTKGE